MTVTATEWIRRAQETRDPSAADRCILEALRLEPDLAPAYVQRARLAVVRGDAVAAAHHFRVAYARGDRTAETRVGLAIALTIAGQVDLAERVREGEAAPSLLVDFEDACEAVARPVRQMLAVPLPARGEPALLPGERLPPAPTEPGTEPPASIRTTAEQASLSLPPAASPTATGGIRVVRTTAPPEAQTDAGSRFAGERRTLRSDEPGPPEIASQPHPVTPQPAAPSAQITRSASNLAAQPAPGSVGLPQAPPAVTLPPAPAAPSTATSAPVALPSGRRLPDWLDAAERLPANATPVGTGMPDWVTSNVDTPAPASIVGTIDLTPDDQELVVTNDPGSLDISFRSPVTGRTIRPDELARARADAVMPSLERAPDLLGRAAIFADLIDTRRLVLALELPGPVLTAPGAPPRPLCRVMAFGATREELFFRDIERDGLAPVRLPRGMVQRMDVLNDDQQITFVLGDGRQLHLDLRNMARAHGSTVRQLVLRLEALMPGSP